jgi:phosphoribosylaminoimidazolecarboxamide formyltransferase/IMP cyclohydrolase
MSDKKKIKTAFVSVYQKGNLDDIILTLHAQGVSFISTGGTQTFIESLSVPCQTVERLTGYPSIFGGRVKTLHPKVFGGILYRRDVEEDLAQVAQYEIPTVDLVIVDQYQPFLDIIHENGAVTTLEERTYFAKEAFAVSSGYDTAIFNYFDGNESSRFRVAEDNAKVLRYGENPHQKGVFYGELQEMFQQLQGKEISYNNLLDIDAAIRLISDFDEMTFAILKHNNACGLASRNSLLEAWKAALEGDPVSAYGGVLITNAIVDKATAQEINKIFFEVIIAPDYDVEALEILTQKKNRIILVLQEGKIPSKQFRSALNGILVQDQDQRVERATDLKVVTQKAPSEIEIEDMLFANKIVKHSKSNAIVLAKNKQLCGSGVGQTSRVDALRHAVEKAHAFRLSLQGAVMASDAYFPFSDSVEIAHQEGIIAIIQPGGSIRDQDSIDACNVNQQSMVTTGIRHFKH